MQGVCEERCLVAVSQAARIAAEFLAGKWFGEILAVVEGLRHG